jgi:hypothetical protein
MLFEFWFVSSSYFSSTSLLLWGIVWYRFVRPQHKVRTAVCERFQGFVLNIAIAKSPWVQETESRGIWKTLVRQHHLLHNESMALCQQMLTCSLSEPVVCSLRGSRQTNKNGIRQSSAKTNHSWGTGEWLNAIPNINFPKHHKTISNPTIFLKQSMYSVSKLSLLGICGEAPTQS